jgi:Nuclear protein Es2
MGTEVGKTKGFGELMLPPPPRLPTSSRNKQTVLEEEEWTEKIEAIVERDFFPDIPKLQNKLEWLQVRSPSVGGARKLA